MHSYCDLYNIYCSYAVTVLTLLILATARSWITTMETLHVQKRYVISVVC
jgi:hypothetical protein